MGVAHVHAVGGELVGNLPVVHHVALLRALPGAEMQLIDAHRRAEDVLFAPLIQIIAVAPAIIVDRPDAACGGGTGLAVRGKGIGLQPLLAVRAEHAVFIERAVLQPFLHEHPGAVGEPLHRVGCAVPVVEFTHQRHGFGIRRPDREAVCAVVRLMAAEELPDVHRPALVKAAELLRRQRAGNDIFHTKSSLSSLSEVF